MKAKLINFTKNCFNRSRASKALLVFSLLFLVLFILCLSFSKQAQEQPSAVLTESNNSYKTTSTTRIEISPENYRHNLEIIKKIVGPDVNICAVMKSDAYGHGINNLIAETVECNPAYIAAIYNSEFKTIYEEIKKQKKDISLLRIAPVFPDELAESIGNNWDIEEIIGSLEEAKMISATARKLSRSQGRNITVGVHINIETGMGRMAFRNIDDIRRTLELPHLKLKGVMTHFANAYKKEPMAEKETRHQTEIFDKVVKELDLNKSIIRHVANSGATMNYPWTRKDMVRVGSITYGEDLEDLDPKNELLPVMTSYKGKVAIIENNIPPMSPISYDSMERTRKKGMSTTATVRAGYNEGFPEMAFKQNIQVLIRGTRFPVIGKTSMNMFVVDITDQDKNNPVQLYDEVVLIGKQGEQEIFLEEFASKCNRNITQLIILLGNVTHKTTVSGYSK